MVEEVGYNARVRVQAGAQLPGVSADSFGAGVGQALSQAGAVIQQERLEDARIDRNLRDNREWSAFLVEDAKAREEIGAMAREGRLSDEPGHARRIADQIARREELLIGMLTSDQLKQQARVRLAEWGGSLRTREADYEFLRGQEIAIEGFEEQRGIAEGRVRRLEKPDDYRLELKLQVDAINALNTSDEVKQKLIDETEQRFGVAFIRGMTDRDPEAARALIDSGAFDGIITGDQVEVLRGGVEVEIRRIAAAREREVTEAKAKLREQLQVFDAAEAAGLISEPEAFDAAIAQAQAIGDESLAVQLTVKKANQAFIRVWGPENATALQREQRIAALAGKDKRTAEENLELTFLRDRSPGWASEEARDPVGQAAQRGGTGAPPVVDFNDPASIRARGQWAAARSAEGRRVPAFTATEARELATLYDSGRAGEEQVMAVLAALPPAQAMESAKQIEPNDRTLPVIVTLAPGLRNQARRGREALRANRNLLSDPMRDDAELTEAISVHNRAFEQALRFVPPEQRAAILETAKQLAAGQVDKFGEPVNERLWSASLKFALGGRMTPQGWRGGFDYWADRPFLLPSGISKEEFKRAAIGYSQGVTDYPANPDGSRANLFRAYPVAVRPGVYQFHTPSGGVIKTKSGKTFEVPIGAVE